MKLTLEKYNPIFLHILEFYRDKSMSLDSWVDQELSLEQNVFQEKYGEKHRGIREIMKKQVELRE